MTNESNTCPSPRTGIDAAAQAVPGRSLGEQSPVTISQGLRMSAFRGSLSGGWSELLLVAALYVAYSLGRTLANNAILPADAHARAIAALERGLDLAWETAANAFYAQHATLSLVSDYWYCTAHYVLTPVVLVWLYRQGPATYRPMRRALVLATVAALALYIILPTAPPRLMPGYIDVLAQHAHQGWWGHDASAPKGMGWLTNRLAAFPSMHAGYALWVAIALHRHSHARWTKVLGWATAAMTAATVVGTANHWILDVLAGWAIVILAVALGTTVSIRGLVPLAAGEAVRRPADEPSLPLGRPEEASRR